MKVSELSGAHLALWVAMAEGLGSPSIIIGACVADGYEEYAPHEDWTQGGPIIDQQRPELIPCWPAGGWYARSQHRPCDGDQYFGETALIAAMRAYVASKYGDTVPDEPA